MVQGVSVLLAMPASFFFLREHINSQFAAGFVGISVIIWALQVNYFYRCRHQH